MIIFIFFIIFMAFLGFLIRFDQIMEWTKRKIGKDKYRVHIYEVSGMYEIDVEAYDDKEAEERAFVKLKKSKRKLVKSDKDKIALSFFVK